MRNYWITGLVSIVLISYISCLGHTNNTSFFWIFAPKSGLNGWASGSKEQEIKYIWPYINFFSWSELFQLPVILQKPICCFWQDDKPTQPFQEWALIAFQFHLSPASVQIVSCALLLQTAHLTESICLFHPQSICHLLFPTNGVALLLQIRAGSLPLLLLK